MSFPVTPTLLAALINAFTVFVAGIASCTTCLTNPAAGGTTGFVVGAAVTYGTGLAAGDVTTYGTGLATGAGATYGIGLATGAGATYGIGFAAGDVTTYGTGFAAGDLTTYGRGINPGPKGIVDLAAGAIGFALEVTGAAAFATGAAVIGFVLLPAPLPGCTTTLLLDWAAPFPLSAKTIDGIAIMDTAISALVVAINL
jgi:hypothetical protein